MPLAETEALALLLAAATTAMMPAAVAAELAAAAELAFCTRTPTQADVAAPAADAAAPAVKFADAVFALCAATVAEPSRTISALLVLAELEDADAWPVLRNPPKAVELDAAPPDALAAKVVVALAEPKEAALPAAET